MTRREQEIVAILREDPLISQQALADRLGITRSSVGVHIANLLKKGVILGKGYVIRSDAYVSVLGGANMDIQGFPRRKLLLRDSNPGKVLHSMGGVGRNIAENLARLGVEVKLLTLLGDDLYGQQIRRETGRAGVDMTHAETVPGETTGTYLSLLDETGDMKAAVNAMDIYERMNRSFIDRKHPVLSRSSMVVLDTNPPEEVLRHLANTLPGQKFIADPVSAAKAVKLKDLLPCLHTVKPNRLEAEVLTGVEITGRDSMDEAADVLLEAGVRQVFLTLGPDGTYYCDGQQRGILRANKTQLVNATGAGDAFTAGLVLGNLRDWSIEETARFATGAALLALSHKDTINPYFSEEAVYQTIREAELC